MTKFQKSDSSVRSQRNRLCHSELALGTKEADQVDRINHSCLDKIFSAQLENQVGT